MSGRITFAITVLSINLSGCLETSGTIAGDPSPAVTFLWGQPDTTHGGFFTHNIEYPGYGPVISYHQDAQERFLNHKSVRFYTVFEDLTGVSDPIVSHPTNQRVELHSYEPYRALGARTGEVVWLGWSQMYTHIGVDHPFTDLQLRSQSPGVTGSPAVELAFKEATRELHLSAGPGFRQVVQTVQLGIWYDFVLEIKYSQNDDGYVRVWAAASDSGSVALDYDDPTVEALNMPTMHNGKTFINRWADNDQDRYTPDDYPHLRWGVYPWGTTSSFPEGSDAYIEKFLGPVRIYVGDDQEKAYNAVLPRPSSDPAPPPAHLALGKPTTQSSRSGNGDASIAVDGNTYGGNPWDGIGASTTDEYQPWIEVDLEVVQPITTIKIWNRMDCCGDRLDNAVVLVSENPIASTILADALAQVGVWSADLGTAGVVNTVNVNGTKGRYVRLQLPDNGIINIGEIEVF